MDRTHLQQCVIETIADIQVRSGLSCPKLSGDVKPALDVPEFSSEICIAATTLLAAKTELEIPDDCNLFFDKKKGRETSIREIAAQLESIQDSTIKADAE